MRFNTEMGLNYPISPLISANMKKTIIITGFGCFLLLFAHLFVYLQKRKKFS